VMTPNIKAGSKLGHHVCTTCGRPFSRSYSARRHLRDQHQGYGQITSLTEYIFWSKPREVSDAYVHAAKSTTKCSDKKMV
jgi:uncharacterized Zn-finger protein